MPVKQRVSGEQITPQTSQSCRGLVHFLHKQQGLYNIIIKRHPDSFEILTALFKVEIC